MRDVFDRRIAHDNTERDVDNEFGGVGVDPIRTSLSRAIVITVASDEALRHLQDRFTRVLVGAVRYERPKGEREDSEEQRRELGAD